MPNYNPFENDRGTPIRGGTSIGALPAEVPEGTRAIWIGGGGTLNVICKDGSNVVLQNVSDGVLIPIHIQTAQAGTTCADMVALR